MNESLDILRLFHSLLRWFILFAVGTAGIVALMGYIKRAPIIVWERSVSILAMVLCHVQILVGVIFYLVRWKRLNKMWENMPDSDMMRFAKYEHPAMMILAIGLVTAGRLSSKRAHTEQGKQLRVAIFYLIALIIMLWYTPWPGTAVGQGRGWL